MGVELIAGDLQQPAALTTLVTGAAAVVHGAGAVRGNCQADFDAVNVAGSATVLEVVARECPSARLVHLSSIVAREPQLSHYARSKRSGEDLLQGYPQLDWVVLRPPAVYGPGDREMLPIFQTMARGFATVPGSPDARTSLIHVTDLVAAIIACLQSAAARGGVFELDDGAVGGYSWRELAAVGGATFGRRVRLWQVPAPLLDLVARCNSALARVTGSAPMLTPPKLRELRHTNWVADSEPLRSVTGWEPAVNFADGLRALNLDTGKQ